MKRFLLIAALGAILLLPTDSESGGPGFAGARPAGGGGARPGGAGAPAGGGFHAATPSFSRPATPNFSPPARPNFANNMARPGMVPSQPHGGGNFANASRPAMPQTRPNLPSGGSNPGQHTAMRPNFPAPSGGGVNRPTFPGAGGAGTQHQFPNMNPNTRPGQGGSGTQANIANLRPQVRPGQGGAGTQTNVANLRPEIRPGQGGSGAQLFPNTRPETRPGQGGSGTEQFPNLRPGTRPGQGGSGTQQPIPDRPIINNRPDLNRPFINNRPGDNNVINNRPNLNIGNNLINNNVNNVNVNQWNQYNTAWSGGGSWWNRPGNWNVPAYANRPAWYWGRPYYQNHWQWHNGYWNYGASPAAWLGAGAAAGWLASPGDSFTYSNPYYVEPPSTTLVSQTYNYADAIPVPTGADALAAYPPDPGPEELSGDVAPPEAPPPPANEDPNVTEANRLFDAARAAFKQGSYADAQAQDEKAIALLPSDATLHEFRALTLFAQGKYKDAAATLYAVLAAGPGWDWTTMSGLYWSPDLYTSQLRRLEEYMRSHPDKPEGHFLLAYHYLVLGSKDAAVAQLKEVVRLQPKDKLATSLVQALTSNPPATAEGT